VVALGGAAGIACGPAAPACGAALATATNLAWDGAESAIRGKPSGSIAGFINIANGNATAGEVFDVVAEQEMVAAGGALGATPLKIKIKGSRPSGSRPSGSRPSGSRPSGSRPSGSRPSGSKPSGSKPSNAIRCKRSSEKFEIFTMSLPDIPEFASKALPASFHDLNTTEWNNVDQGINAIFSIFLIIKLLFVGHPKSQGYFEEVCENVYPFLELQV